jgi:methyltransferase (TIGR00027 family)
MAPDDRVIRNISDTARWVATYRAQEAERPDALFRDPFARRLAGERGELIRQQISTTMDLGWVMVTRTHIFDRVIAGRVAAGVEAVTNLAAGLDARPYRMELPPELRWVEIDLPELLAYKEGALAGEAPKCRLERVALDLSDGVARRDAFARIGKGLAISEGLLVYLADEEVAQLGRDLAAAGFEYWAADFASPPLLRMLQSTIGRHTAAAGAPMRFAPPEGVKWFEPLGWKPVSVETLFDTAVALGRIPPEVLAAPPPPPQPDGAFWSGVVLFEQAS